MSESIEIAEMPSSKCKCWILWAKMESVQKKKAFENTNFSGFQASSESRYSDSKIPL